MQSGRKIEFERLLMTRQNHHRPTYQAGWPPERFIVPLLAKRVPYLFEEWGAGNGKGQPALDAGCGAQPFRHMIEGSGYIYRSFDVVQNQAGSVDFLGALDAPLPADCLAGGPYAFIMATEVLEHVAGWELAFANLARLLAPAGRVLLSCPHVYPPHEEPYDFWRPTTNAVAYHAKQNGLVVKHMERAGGPHDVLGTILEDTQCYPAFNTLKSRGCGWIVRFVRKQMLRILHDSNWRRLVEFRGGFYLSCIAILEKSNTTTDA
jgi:SAM-dependent methyltransferase